VRCISFKFGATGSTSGGTKGEGAISSRDGSGTPSGSALSGVGIKSSSWGELSSSAGTGAGAGAGAGAGTGTGTGTGACTGAGTGAGAWTSVGSWGGEGVTGVGC
jgi:hypothetical protein